jgi:hypothetical protein
MASPGRGTREGREEVGSTPLTDTVHASFISGVHDDGRAPRYFEPPAVLDRLRSCLAQPAVRTAENRTQTVFPGHR